MKKYKIGDIVKGKVTGVEDYGIFLLVDDNVTGLIHISEISDGFVRNVADYAEIGEVIKAEVIEYDEVNKKLKLSIKKDGIVKKSKKNVPIKETETGFSGLSKKLDEWINDKEIEMSKK
ncbi:MAG: S1 RNA-binding domain-containing protein [Bacilli bacterium]|nr:S1 RNA-binding domain-containing protein [Bacilli bacterium]